MAGFYTLEEALENRDCLTRVEYAVDPDIASDATAVRLVFSEHEVFIGVNDEEDTILFPKNEDELSFAEGSYWKDLSGAQTWSRCIGTPNGG